MGRPIKKRLEVVATLTLKRARRSAPHAAKRKAAARPSLPKWWSCQAQASTPGATPKAMASARESYSTPNWLADPVRRATLPSRPSMSALNRIAHAASSKFPANAMVMLRKPAKRLAVVNRLGRIYTPRGTGLLGSRINHSLPSAVLPAVCAAPLLPRTLCPASTV